MRLSRGNLARKLYSDEPMVLRTPHLRKRKKGWWRLLLFGSSCLVFITFIVLFYLTLCTKVVEEQYALDHYQSMLPVLREENANLLLGVRSLNQLGRIEWIARHKLHMGLPEGRLMIEPDESSDVRISFNRMISEKIEPP